MAGYSFWPEQGWDGLFQDLADAVTENGGEIRMGTPAERVIIENHEVKGVAVARQPRILPNEIFEEEIIECDAVVSTLPVWDVLKVVPGSGAARLVRRPDQLPRPAPLQGDVARPLPRHERAGGDPRPQGALDLAARAAHADARLLLRADRLRPDDGAARHLPLRDGRRDPGRAGHRPAVPARDVREVRAGDRDHVPGAREPGLAPAAPRPQPVLRRDPEARPRRRCTARTGGRRTSTASTSRARRSAAAASASTAPPAPG